MKVWFVILQNLCKSPVCDLWCINSYCIDQTRNSRTRYKYYILILYPDIVNTWCDYISLPHFNSTPLNNKDNII